MATLFPKHDLLATMRCEAETLLPCKLDWPFHRICYWGGLPKDNRPPGSTRWTDAWGVTWQKQSPDPAMMPYPAGHPLVGRLKHLDRYPWPDPENKQRFADLQNVRPTAERLLVGKHPFAIFERAWLLMGVQPLLEAMIDRPNQVMELLDRITTFELGIARQYLKLGVEAAWIADEYNVNNGTMFAPELWQRYIKIHLQRLVDFYHQAGVVVVLHSPGNIMPLVGHFLEIGIDVLDPLQPSCNRLGQIRRQTAGRICLCGGIASSILLSGNDMQTKADTLHRIAELGTGGCYIVGPDDEWDYPEITRHAMLDGVHQHRDRMRRQRQN